jgi:hypothetical protein
MCCGTTATVAIAASSARRTSRTPAAGRRGGAVVWGAGDGPKPTPAHLTPDEAADALRAILAGAPRVPQETSTGASTGVPTFDGAVQERLRYLGTEKKRKPSTFRDYRNVARHDLHPHFGKETPMRKLVRGRVVGDTFTSEDIDTFRRELLAREDLSTRPAQKVMALCHGVFKVAKRRKMIDANPCLDVERIAVKASDDFNVLSPMEFEAVVRECGSPREVAVVSVGF